MTPNYKSDELCRPKLRNTQLDVLKALVYFGTSFTSSNTVKYKAAALLEVLRYTLTSFHLIFKNISLFAQNHERIPFIENIVLSLLVLSKILGFVEYETQFTSNKYLDLNKSDYRSSTIKYNDALGCFKIFNNTEFIFHTVHTIKDCLKLLEYGISSQRKEVILNKNSPIATFKKLKVFGVTLSELSINNDTSWNFIEKRTARLPSSWDDRILLIQYFELIATIFIPLVEAINERKLGAGFE
ncbi:MAG: hypothetical protein EXX96DRAFT_597207 [Benjaminiella poitrasii]|nr:MAG: hypothetical protein EXX96DRAFT_597207 [Benjaminiella poitrasii]